MRAISSRGMLSPRSSATAKPCCGTVEGLVAAGRRSSRRQSRAGGTLSRIAGWFQGTAKRVDRLVVLLLFHLQSGPGGSDPARCQGRRWPHLAKLGDTVLQLAHRMFSRTTSAWAKLMRRRCAAPCNQMYTEVRREWRSDFSWGKRPRPFPELFATRRRVALIIKEGDRHGGQTSETARPLAQQAVEGGQADGQLLAHSSPRAGEASFAALLQRHGPMVLGVCRRVLRHSHDAEDAFQATFLVLAHQAASVVPARLGELLALRGRLPHGGWKRRRLRPDGERGKGELGDMPHPEVNAAEGTGLAAAAGSLGVESVDGEVPGSGGPVRSGGPTAAGGRRDCWRCRRAPCRRRQDPLYWLGGWWPLA